MEDLEILLIQIVLHKEEMVVLEVDQVDIILAVEQETHQVLLHHKETMVEQQLVLQIMQLLVVAELVQLVLMLPHQQVVMVEQVQLLQLLVLQ